MFRKFFSVFLILLLTAVLFNLIGCGKSNPNGPSPSPTTSPTPSPTTTPTTSPTPTHVVFICVSAPDADATAFKTFLEAAEYTVDIIGLDGIVSADFSDTDLIIVGGFSADWINVYPTEATTLYNTNKPILCINRGDKLFDTADFGLFINNLHSGTGSTASVKVNNASDQFWSTPNNITVTTGGDLAVYSSAKSTETVCWVTPPASAHDLSRDTGLTTYSSLCYQIKNTVRYFHWGFAGAPADMTADGQILFKNVVYWMINGDI
jgi:hypothetical protein